MIMHSRTISDTNLKPDDQTQSVGPPPASSSPPHALDGSQYHNIIEEQVYAEQRPTAEEQKPWRIFHPQTDKPDETRPDEPTISVGPR